MLKFFTGSRSSSIFEGIKKERVSSLKKYLEVSNLAQSLALFNADLTAIGDDPALERNINEFKQILQDSYDTSMSPETKNNEIDKFKQTMIGRIIAKIKSETPELTEKIRKSYQ